jgi:acyl carrier protein phosphodiesterase
MNYLAHIYLSGKEPQVILGNFMADSIKGNQYKNYPKQIQKGILLHRHIDSTTDAHPSFRNSTKRLHANYGHYSGIIVDIFYDHFLAKNWNDYETISLEEFTNKSYQLFKENHALLTPQTQYMLPYMVKNNWFYNYQYLEGIADTLTGMNRRTKNKSGMDKATYELMEYYEAFEADFRVVFKTLMQRSEKFIKYFN